LGVSLLLAESPEAQRVLPNLESNIERPLRYHPEGEDFVIENGTERFNRPLYGGNSAFRVDGGDRPEFVLYLPGRGGNLRLALRQGPHAKWLHETAQITTRYRPGSLLYEIRDPLLGPSGRLQLHVLAYHEAEGLILRVNTERLPEDLELVWVFGGVNGQRGTRDGDIGTERVPISEWFQLQPGFCADNRFLLQQDGFLLQSKAATLKGILPTGSTLSLRDASLWQDLSALLTSSPQAAPSRPLLMGQCPLREGVPLLLSFQRVPGAEITAELGTYVEVGAPQEKPAPVVCTPTYTRDEVPSRFSDTEAHFTVLRRRVSVDTPDAFLNAAVGALNVAADAVWDEPSQGIMHGAIAWRTRLLGWRGPYALDALGWTDRARSHFEYWALRQNLSPVPPALPPADENARLARNETGLHSNGDLSNSHYDMNLVFVDALFRHLRWTGDLELARRLWPVLERHLAWERRLFRREYTTTTGQRLPLYEAYAAIWASDDLQYSGGGSAHGSAYNLLHNRLAARLAALVGADPAPYAQEATLIERGLRELLWQEDTGMFGEYKDWLGLQRVHPAAALWSFYQVMDAEFVTPAEARRMSAYVRQCLPRLPVRGPGVPGGLVTLGTSTWMPYTWSLNNVCMNENAHAALGLWQAGEHEEAYRVLKGSLLASMYLGISPGNVGTMNLLDVYRRESQRDFADGSGTLSRALIEGLFGIHPDLLIGVLRIAPGLPAAWDHATLHHPFVDLSFHRDAARELWEIDTRLSRPADLRLELPARGSSARVTLNGSTCILSMDAENGLLHIAAPAASHYRLSIEWQGDAPARPARSGPKVDHLLTRYATPSPTAVLDELDLGSRFNDRVTEIFREGKYRSPRSPFVSLAQPSQGVGYWAGHLKAMPRIDDSGLRRSAAEQGGQLRLPSGLHFATPGPGDTPNILFTSRWDNYPTEASLPLHGHARRLYLLMAGSTNAMQSRIDNGEVLVRYADGSSARLPLRNPETWWPIEQDYFIDDFQFPLEGELPTRIDLKTGMIRDLNHAHPTTGSQEIDGGSATVLQLELDPAKELSGLTLRCLSNETVIGLMAATLER
jgi:hypothetical protein